MRNRVARPARYRLIPPLVQLPIHSTNPAADLRDGGRVERYTDQFLQWMNKSPEGQHAAELVAFYHRVGFEYFWQQRGDGRKAAKYLNYGLRIDPGNGRMNADLAEIEELGG